MKIELDKEEISWILLGLDQLLMPARKNAKKIAQLERRLHQAEKMERQNEEEE